MDKPLFLHSLSGIKAEEDSACKIRERISCEKEEECKQKEKRYSCVED